MVDLCKLLTDKRAANTEKSGCWVDMYAAVSAASVSNSWVVTPGKTPWTTFCEMITGSIKSFLCVWVFCCEHHETGVVGVVLVERGRVDKWASHGRREERKELSKSQQHETKIYVKVLEGGDNFKKNTKIWIAALSMIFDIYLCLNHSIVWQYVRWSCQRTLFLVDHFF